MSQQEAATVLVVDDDAPTRWLLEREAADAGHRVRSVADAEAAVAAMAQSPADILVSDIRLPGRVSGLDLCALVRRLHPQTELVLVTGFASIDAAIEGVKLGACDFIVKPFDDLSLVRASLAKASARIALHSSEQRQAATLRARAAGHAALLDRIPVAVFLAGADGRVLARNSAADRLLASADGLTVDAVGRLAASASAVQGALEAALRASCGASGGEAVAIRVARRSGRQDLRVVVAPLPPRAMGCELHEPLAAILVEDSERGAVLPSAEILSLYYGLTPAEAQLAARLVGGDSVHEACDALGIAVPTGRTHLSRIFHKTGTSRQGDLIGLVLCGPALLATGGASARSARRR